MDRLNIVDDVVLWLSLLSVAAICVVMFYYGVTGLAHVPSTDFSPEKKAFGSGEHSLCWMPQDEGRRNIYYEQTIQNCSDSR